MNCMNYDHKKNSGLFRFQSSNREFYLNSMKGYSQKIIKTGYNILDIMHLSIFCPSGQSLLPGTQNP